MTEKLWMKNSYIREWRARIEKVTASKFVVLDKSAFYPEKGGQPSDFGKIILQGNEFNVLFGKDFGTDVSYEVSEQGLKEGDNVLCVLDWKRRYKLMRMHTAAHILHNVIFGETGALISGNQLDVEKSRMDFCVENFDRELLNGFVEKANELLARNLPIEVKFLPREEAFKIPGIIRLKDKLPKAVEVLRIVDIGGVDITADGGTHVRNTDEVGKIKIEGMKNKGKNNRRIYFSLEGEA